MTDNEIIKALELCNMPVSEANCPTCPFYKNKIGCSHVMMNEAIDLISRLKAKNKEFDEKIVIQRGAIDWQAKEIKRQQAENTDLFYKLSGVMLFVDKWLEGDELKQDEVNRAATMREKTLCIVEKQQAEIEQWKTLANEGKEKVELLEIEKSAMKHRIDEQQAEIEKLRGNQK